MPVFGLVTWTRKHQPPLLRSKFVKVPCLPAATVTAPTVVNAELAGVFEAEPSLGGVGLLQLTPVAEPVVVPTCARWTLYDVTVLLSSAVNVKRTSAVSVPLSKLPTAAARLVGATAPRFWHMLNVEIPAGFGS